MAIGAMPRVSVIVPAYNVSPYIRLAVDSALAQTFENLEILVIDDGSTDGTVEKLNEVKDDRLRIFSQAHAGVAQSRNLGVHLARGTYIGFLDGDDIWNPNKIAKQVELMDSCPDTDLCFSLSQRIDESGRDCGLPPPQIAAVVSFRNLLLENLIRTPSSVVARKDALQSAGSFDPSLVPCEDYEMWIRISKLRPHNIRCLVEILTMYRRRSSQLTRNWSSVELSWNRMIEKIGLREGQAVYEILPQARSRMYFYLASLAYENGEFSEAVRLLWIGYQSHYRSSIINARNLALVTATLSGSLLPKFMHQKLENLCMRWIKAIY